MNRAPVGDHNRDSERKKGEVTVEKQQRRWKDREEQTSLLELKAAVENCIITHNSDFVEKTRVATRRTAKHFAPPYRPFFQSTEMVANGVTWHLNDVKLCQHTVFDDKSIKNILEFVAKLRLYKENSDRQEGLRDLSGQVFNMMSVTIPLQKAGAQPVIIRQLTRTVIRDSNCMFSTTITGQKKTGNATENEEKAKETTKTKNNGKARLHRNWHKRISLLKIQYHTMINAQVMPG